MHSNDYSAAHEADMTHGGTSRTPIQKSRTSPSLFTVSITALLVAIAAILATYIGNRIGHDVSLAVIVLVFVLNLATAIYQERKEPRAKRAYYKGQTGESDE